MMRPVRTFAALLAGVVLSPFAAVGQAQPSRALTPAAWPRLAMVDERFQSYNVEMVEVTGGRFWAPYRAASPVDAPKPPEAGGAAPAGLDPSLFRNRTPLDLSNPRLRKLAAALGPAYMRVSGTWANSTYFHDSDERAPAAPPPGFGGILTRGAWRGVIEFSRAVNAPVITSFEVSPGVRDDSGAWTPTQARKIADYTKSIGGSIAAAELFNEPNLAAMGGAPKGYDAAAYGRDFQAFRGFAKQSVPGMMVLGPGSVGEGGLAADFPGQIRSADLLAASGPGVDAFSYHFYGAVSRRCSAMGNAPQASPDAALSEEWLGRTDREAVFYAGLRDRFEPGKPLWLTETGETACGGNPWAATFLDTFRYLEQLGRLARRGVQVVAHNTLAASDYAIIDEETMSPRPSYWGALLWRKLMGHVVLDAGAPQASSSGLHVFAHCLRGNATGGVAVLAVNTSRTAAQTVEAPGAAEHYTLSAAELQSAGVSLNGRPLLVGIDGEVPDLRGQRVAGTGKIELAPASITFLTIPTAGNPACRSSAAAAN